MFIDFYGFRSMGVYIGMERLVAPTKTSARFQAGFLSSRDFHRAFLDVHRFVLLFVICVTITQIFMDFGAWYIDNERPAALIETCARFQAGFLSSGDFHHISSISIDFVWFSKIFIDFY